MKRSAFVLAALLIATPVVAQFGGGPMMPGVPGMTFTVPGAFDLPVASDGTVFITRNVPGGGVELAAIRPSGAVAWTFRIQMPLSNIAINDTTVLISWRTSVVTVPNVATKSHLTALSLASGNVMGTNDLDGDFMKITAFPAGFYALRLIPNGAGPRPGTTLLTRKLVAFDNKATELWSMTLD